MIEGRRSWAVAAALLVGGTGSAAQAQQLKAKSGARRPEQVEAPQHTSALKPANRESLSHFNARVDRAFGRGATVRQKAEQDHFRPKLPEQQERRLEEIADTIASFPGRKQDLRRELKLDKEQLDSQRDAALREVAQENYGLYRTAKKLEREIEEQRESLRVGRIMRPSKRPTESWAQHGLNKQAWRESLADTERRIGELEQRLRDVKRELGTQFWEGGERERLEQVEKSFGNKKKQRENDVEDRIEQLDQERERLVDEAGTILESLWHQRPAKGFEGTMDRYAESRYTKTYQMAEHEQQRKLADYAGEMRRIVRELDQLEADKPSRLHVIKRSRYNDKHAELNRELGELFETVDEQYGDGKGFEEVAENSEKAKQVAAETEKKAKQFVDSAEQVRANEVTKAVSNP